MRQALGALSSDHGQRRSPAARTVRVERTLGVADYRGPRRTEAFLPRGQNGCPSRSRRSAPARAGRNTARAPRGRGAAPRDAVSAEAHFRAPRTRGDSRQRRPRYHPPARAPRPRKGPRAASRRSSDGGAPPRRGASVLERPLLDAKLLEAEFHGRVIDAKCPEGEFRGPTIDDEGGADSHERRLPSPLLAAAALLAILALARAPRPSERDALAAGGLAVVAFGARAALGVWGPWHINGQGPLWILGGARAGCAGSLRPRLPRALRLARGAPRFRRSKGEATSLRRFSKSAGFAAARRLRVIRADVSVLERRWTRGL
jgi:hypothetical protein